MGGAGAPWRADVSACRAAPGRRPGDPRRAPRGDPHPPAAPAPPPDGALAGEVRQAAYLGAAAEYTVDTEVGVVAVTDALMPEGLLPTGARVWLTFSPERLAVLPAGPAGEAS